MEETILNSAYYAKDAKQSMKRDILVMVLYILLDIFVLAMPTLMRWDKSITGLQVGLLIAVHTAGPLFFFGREHVKTTTYFVGNSNVVDQVFERTMGREGLFCALGLGVAFVLLYMFLNDHTRLRYIIEGVHIVAMIFLMAFPLGSKALHYVNCRKILQSAKQQQNLQEDTVTKELYDKLDWSLFRIKGISICVLIVALIIAIIIGNGVGKDAVISEEALDIKACILDSDMGEEVETAILRNNYPYYALHHGGQQCTVELTVWENQAGLYVPMEYEITLGFEKKTRIWSVIDVDKTHVFASGYTLEDGTERKQAGFFRGKGKLLGGSQKADVEVIFTGYDYYGADGSIILSFSDGTIRTSKFTAICETEKRPDSSEVLHYQATLATPFDKESAIVFSYDMRTFDMEVTYMGNTVDVEHFVPEA